MTRTEPGRIHHVADQSGLMHTSTRRLGLPVFPAGAYAQGLRLRRRVVESRCRVDDGEGAVRDMVEADQSTGTIVPTAGIIKAGIIKAGIIATGIM